MNPTDALKRFNEIRDMPDDDCEIFLMIRDLLIYDEFDELYIPNANDHPLSFEIAHLLTIIANDAELMTQIALSFSLCPLHMHDYAICFDDDDPDCAPIRIIHPDHDT